MLPRLRELAERHWRIVAVALVVLFAFAAGRHTAPTRIEEVTLGALVVRAKDEKQETKAAAESKVEVRVVERWYSPTGVIQHERDETGSAEERADFEEIFASHEEAREEVRIETRAVEAARPDWRIGALVAVDYRAPLTPAYGAHVERRLFGPLSAGGFILSSGHFGVSATMEF